jgi:AcrR family transcriptional regulator
MQSSDDKRTRILRAVADHVLDHGLVSASLRPMAKTAGTSDRMLIYHFGSRSLLIEAVLEHLAERVKQHLDAALPETPFPDRDAAIESIMGLLRTQEMRRFNAVWFEILGKAAAGDAVYRTAARQIMSTFAEWLEPRVPETDSDRRAQAWELLTWIEGQVVMDAADHARNTGALQPR